LHKHQIHAHVRRTALPLSAVSAPLLAATTAEAAAPPNVGPMTGTTPLNPSAPPTTPEGGKATMVRILALNDFHGQLTNGNDQLDGQAVGGAATLAAYLNRERAGNPNGTIITSSGDAWGASEPESTLLGHKSSIAALTAMNVGVATPGNHEWDTKYAGAMRLMFGGSEPRVITSTKRVNVNGKIVTETVRHTVQGPSWPGTPFPWVSANIVDKRTGRLIMPPYVIKTVNGVKVAFIGAVTKDLLNVTMKSGIPNLEAIDPATAINRFVPQIEAQGVHTIVALVHEGGFRDPKTGQVTGPIVDVAKRLSPDVSVIASAHTHQEYATRIAGHLVTQGLSYAKAFSEIDLAIDPKTDKVIDDDARVIHNLRSGIAPDPTVGKMVSAFAAKVAPITQRVLSILPGPVTRTESAAGESALGTLIASAQRRYGKTDIAFMNPGGIRQDLTHSGPVTWGDAFAVQPFANHLITSQMTGADIESVLEQMFPAAPGPDAHSTILQVSGLRVWYDARRPAGHRIVKVLTSSGAPLKAGASYSVTANSFLMGGGDGFTNFKRAKRQKDIGTDLTALCQYLQLGLPVPLQPVGVMNSLGGPVSTDPH
jgi:2',3'-cyclic-nucleotide 2'-phosphodiesterase (5'-nucleotidase family)